MDKEKIRKNITNEIDIPNGISVSVNNQVLLVKGPKGELFSKVHPDVMIEQKGNEVLVTVKDAEEKSELLEKTEGGNRLKNNPDAGSIGVIYPSEVA